MEKSIADNLRFLREKLGLAFEIMAVKMRLSKQCYSKIEKTPENTSLKKLKQLAKVLNVSLSSLIGETDSYIQQNCGQNGGNAASMINISSAEAYDKLVSHLQSEVSYLRTVLNAKFSA